MIGESVKDRMEREVANLHLIEHTEWWPPVTDGDLGGLPEPAARQMRFMGVVGRPRDWSFELGWTGTFRRSFDAPWTPCEAWQYNDSLSVARIFHIRILAGRVIPVLARDTYVAGEGRMRVRALGLVTIADGRGEPYTMSELVTYLNDAVLIAPSMLLVPQVKWTSVDAQSYEVHLTDHGRTVSGKVTVDERGAPTDFTSMDRWTMDPTEPELLVRTRWSTPVDAWTEHEGRQVIRRARAIYHFGDRELPYADFTPVLESLRFNVSASHPTTARAA